MQPSARGGPAELIRARTVCNEPGDRAPSRVRVGLIIVQIDVHVANEPLEWEWGAVEVTHRGLGILPDVQALEGEHAAIGVVDRPGADEASIDGEACLAGQVTGLVKTHAHAGVARGYGCL